MHIMMNMMKITTKMLAMILKIATSSSSWQ